MPKFRNPSTGRFESAQQRLDREFRSLLDEAESKTEFEEISLEEEAVIMDSGDALLIDGSATAILGPAGFIIGVTVTALIVVGVIAHLLDESSTHGGGGTNTGGGGKTTSGYYPAAADIVYGIDPKSGPTDPVDTRPNINTKKSRTSPKTPQNLNSYLRRDQFMNSLIDWDGFYLQSFSRSNLTSDGVTLVKRPLKIPTVFGTRGEIFVPELLLVQYTPHAVFSVNTMYGFTPAKRLDSTGAYVNEVSVAGPYGGIRVWDPEFRSAVGMYGVTAYDVDESPDKIVDLRDSRGQGLFWPATIPIMVLSGTITYPSATFLYRYRSMTWETYSELIWKFLLVEQYARDILISTPLSFANSMDLINFLNIFNYANQVGA